MKEADAGWEEIADRLIRDLQNGKYVPGDKLPSENKLAGEFQVPRSGVRKAYSRLKELGYIYSLQGYGSFFAGKKEKIPLAMVGRTSFTQKNGGAGHSPRVSKYPGKTHFLPPAHL